MEPSRTPEDSPLPNPGGYEKFSPEFAAIFRMTTLGVAQSDPATRCILSANRAFCAITGYSEGELIGLNVDQINHPEDRARDADLFTRYLRGESPDYQCEKRYIRKDGGIVWVSVNGNVIRDELGRPIRTIALVQDITARVDAERTLATSESRFRAIFTQTTAGVTQTDPTGKFLFANNRYCEIVGYSRDELLQMRMQDITSPDVLPHNVELFNRMWREGTPFVIEKRYIRKDGREVWVSNSVSPALDDNGKPESVVCVTIDITKRKKAEQELAAAQEKLREHAAILERTVVERTARLRETISELEHFSYTITHDMRAPLRAMQAFGQILREEYSDRLDNMGLDYLRRIIEAANRMDSLITESLNYAKTVQTELTLEPIDSDALVRGILESYPQFQPPRAQIVVDGPLPAVMASQAGLTQCFSNLLGNAVKFVEPGKIPEVRVWAEPREGKVRLWVEDKGIGIPPEQQERVFTLFQRMSKQYEGTGVGLALVRKVVEKMRGQVGFESAPGQGSRFWVELASAERNG